MGVYTRAVLGVHLMYRSTNDESISDELYMKQRAFESKVTQLLQDAGVADPVCDFGRDSDSDIEAVAIGARIPEIDYFSECNVLHAAIPELGKPQMDAINAAAALVEQFLLEIGGFNNIKKTVGLAVHGSS